MGIGLLTDTNTKTAPMTQAITCFSYCVRGHELLRNPERIQEVCVCARVGGRVFLGGIYSSEMEEV